MTKNNGQVIVNEMNRLARYINYLIDFDKGYDNYLNQLKENNGICDDLISKSKQVSNAKVEIWELYSKAKKLHNDLKYILQKYKNNLDVNCDLINYGNNLQNAIGKADIRQRYLDKNGNLHVKVYDTYDFNPDEDNPLIIAGKNKMLDRELKPFFTIHDIIIPKEKLKELWQN